MFINDFHFMYLLYLVACIIITQVLPPCRCMFITINVLMNLISMHVIRKLKSILLMFVEK